MHYCYICSLLSKANRSKLEGLKPNCRLACSGFFSFSFCLVEGSGDADEIVINGLT